MGTNTPINNVTGGANTATGYGALFSSTASNNTAQGFDALFMNTTGLNNTAVGVKAMLNNTTGQSNTAVGVNAMFNNKIGTNNIAVGVGAGQALTAGNNNIEIGDAGLAAETNAIRIGKQGTQTQTYIAGISGAPVVGVDVVVAANGRLGVGPPSSARFKRDIRDMGAASDALMKLRPVTFRYKQDPEGIQQYGLVAEEVVKVYPELTVYGPDGKVQTVRYSMLSAMLLNELQKQNKENRRQANQIKMLSAQVAEQKTLSARQMAELSSRQAGQIRQLSAQLADLRTMIERARAKSDRRKLAAAFDS
jgi:hypothetical protein